jgi:hypothetical protein
MNIYSYEQIKKELHGDKGLIKRIREVHLPDTIQMAELAQKEFENGNGNTSDIDNALDELLVKEYNIYLQKQESIIGGFIEFADLEANSLEYPTVRKVVDEYKNLAKKGLNPTIILKGITNMIIALADSNRQSRVSRSGSSLMHHIAYLLNKNGFKDGMDYQREYVLKNGCKLDFFFPNEETYNIEPKNCCAVACQTTSNDRFRLTFAQMPNDTRNRACTAIGNKNFGKKLGPDSLTNNKLIEAKKNGVKFVIFSSGIDSRLHKSNAVMSYQDWFNELKSIKTFWK